MIKIVADASAWIAYFEPSGCPFLDFALGSGQVGIPALVKLEILGNLLDKKERLFLEEFMSNIPVLGINEGHFSRAAKLKTKLAGQSIFLSARDCHVLQCALDEGAMLLSKDSLFREIQESAAVRVQIW